MRSDARMILAVLCLFTSLLIAFKPHSQHVSYAEAISEGLITAAFSSKGGHEGKCVEAKLTNLSDDRITVAVEPGRRLVTENAQAQDILVVHRELVELLPGATRTVALEGYCSQANNYSPALHEPFPRSFLAEGNTARLANFLDQRRFPANAEQHAVWVLTDGLPVSSIHHSNRDSVRELLAFMAEMQGVEVPTYSIQYEEQDGRLFSNKAQAVTVDIRCKIKEPCKLTVDVYNLYGMIVQRDSVLIPASSAVDVYPKTMDVSALPKGKYSFKAYNPAVGKVDEHSIVL